MKDNQTSSTADMVTMIRAYWSLAAKDPVFSDIIALDLLPDNLRRLVATPAARKIYGLLTLPIKRAQAEVLGRARYVEDIMLGMLDEGVSQYVIVGAGMDSFAWRHKELVDKLNVFELDHPATHKGKQQRLQDRQIITPDNLEYVAIDFEKQSIVDALQQSSYDPSKPAVFCWMGVSYYLPEQVVYQALQNMQDFASENSCIVFDYMVAPHLLSLKSQLFFKGLKFGTQREGEPIKNSFDPEELEQKLQKMGFFIEENLSSAGLKQRYFDGNADGLVPLTGMDIMHLRVVRNTKGS